jgi:hypothetical protein
MPNSTLLDIQTKVRRLTRSPSPSQLSDADLNQYINTFLVYNLPDNFRLFSLRSTLTFYTEPYVDVYETRTAPYPVTDPLFDFKNRYLAVHPPVYIAGVQSFYTQYRDVFYSVYPQTASIADTLLRGNLGTGPFTGTVQAHPILQRSLIFTCLNIFNSAMVLVDLPGTNTLGSLIVPDDPTVLYGIINYATGAYTLNFPLATQTNATIWVESISYKPGKPTSMLFFDNKFIIRPVPDKAYSVQIEVEKTPVELLNAGDNPFLKRAYEYIAFGTAIKIFEDRLDYESVNLITPSFLKQESLLGRSTYTQLANQRTQTIYVSDKNYNTNFFNTGWPY